MAITPTDPSLNERGPDEFQRRVIDAPERSIRVLAPAGSGKTETLVRRVRKRVADGVDPRRILVLTFDTNANGAFIAKMGALGLRQRPDTRTLNAFGLWVLRQFFPEERHNVGQPSFLPVDPTLGRLVEMTERRALTEIFGILKSHLFDPRDTDRASKAALQKFVRTHYQRLVPETYFARFGFENAAPFARAVSGEFRRYESFLADRGVIDFDDQKLRAFRQLQAQPEALAGVRARYDEVIVDEFQDINRLDVELIRLVAEKATLVVTGDDDQAIYEFRWASPDFLIDPVKTLGRVFASYELGVNYRCPELILDHAMHLIGHNRHRVAKAPTSGAAWVGTVERIEQGDRLAEAKAILGRIQRLRQEQPGGAFRDIGILYRRNAQHFAIQVALATTGIPYTVRREFDLRIIWDQALRLLDLSTTVRRNDPADVPDYRIAVANFSRFRYITDSARSSIHRAAASDPPGPLHWDVVVAAVEAAAGHARAVEFQTAMRRLSSAATIDMELDIIERDFLGIADSREHAEESPLSLLHDILSRKRSNRLESIERLRSFVAKTAASQASGDAVDLCTCHGAKGRQWRTVVLPSCNEGVFPDPQGSSTTRDLEAERRLFYVAMTRAAEHLVIGHVPASGERKPSRFLYEAGFLTAPKPAATSVPAGAIPRTRPAPKSSANSRTAVTARANPRRS